MVKIRFSKIKPLVFAVFYRLPLSSKEYLEQVQASMSSLDQNSDTVYIILDGDFNLKEVDWNRNLMLNYLRLHGIFSDILYDNFIDSNGTPVDERE